MEETTQLQPPTTMTKKAPRQRLLLSAEEKKKNHIQSEQKRRELIKDGFHTLTCIVPSLNNRTELSSKAEVLSETAEYIRKLLVENKGYLERINMNLNRQQIFQQQQQMDIGFQQQQLQQQPKIPFNCCDFSSPL